MSDTSTQSENEIITGAPSCPHCGGRMWDNRASKRNLNAPDFRCRARSCQGALWPGQHRAAAPIIARQRHEEGGAEEQAKNDSAQDSPVTSKNHAKLRESYLALTAFVLMEVRPKYQQAGMTCNDATVAAIAATLFIASCRREGVAS